MTMLQGRGVGVSNQSVRFWWGRFGPIFAAEIRRRRVESMRSSRWRWRLEDVVVKINGQTHYLWRAVDREGEVPESYVTKRRDKKAAMKFFRKSMRRHGRPDEIVTDRGLVSARPSGSNGGGSFNAGLCHLPGHGQTNKGDLVRRECW